MLHTTVRGALALGACALACVPSLVHAQPAPAFPNPSITLDGKGITIFGSDSVSKVNLRFRVQEIVAATTKGETEYSVGRTTLTTRRARIRIESTLRDPRLRINVQLAFSRIDLDQESAGFANVLRDGYLTWQFTPHLAGSLGQAKLPANRQLLVSSSEIQTADRSPVHATFTVDRDVGAFLSYSNIIGKARYVIRGAVSSGEGRNASGGDNGLAYTTRWELLPFGAFTNGGDYVEGDVSREPSLKLSIAGGVSHNDRAVRTSGQTGAPLYAARSMTTWFTDAVAKRRGVAVTAEYLHRTAPDPITRSGALERHVFPGEGLNVQASWLIPRHNWEPQLRFSTLTPARAIQALPTVEALHESAVGLARYVNGHRIKMNSELMHARFEQLALASRRGAWTLRFGAEVGI